ncbi:hypothetical protein EM864_07180 [Stenotrophomonas acidaminiphila]|nr:hypothetical protein [Stenotrophomonas acidaminiphila]
MVTFALHEQREVTRSPEAGANAVAVAQRRSKRGFVRSNATRLRPYPPAPHPGPRQRRGCSKAGAPAARKPCLPAPKGEELPHSRCPAIHVACTCRASSNSTKSAW